MRKFKLIKEYPGSPKLGIEVNNKRDQNYFYANIYEDDKFYINIGDLNKFSEFWQEIIEKDYEILSFIDQYNGTIIYKEKNTNSMYSGSNFFKVTGETLVNLKDIDIYSVKRLSDGEIFTIGDEILEQRENSKIILFTLSDNEIFIRIHHQVTKGGSTIMLSSNFSKLKKKLFTTEDKVDIYDKDSYYKIINYNSTAYSTQIVKYKADSKSDEDYSNPFNTQCLRFSTKEKAEEYILMNKPCLSINDVLKFNSNYYSLSVGRDLLINRLQTLVKTKL